VSPEAEGAVATPILPPRPNLGPEPWVEPSPLAEAITWWWALALVALAIVIGAILLRRRARLRGRPRPMEATDGPADEATLSPRERMILGAERSRAALASRFGPGWLAKTTEEVGSTPEVGRAFGPERAARLIEFLREADRAKFAASGADLPQWSQWEAWLGEFLAEAGARSTIKGK
jgi:hypothetical protein